MWIELRRADCLQAPAVYFFTGNFVGGGGGGGVLAAGSKHEYCLLDYTRRRHASPCIWTSFLRDSPSQIREECLHKIAGFSNRLELLPSKRTWRIKLSKSFVDFNSASCCLVQYMCNKYSTEQYLLNMFQYSKYVKKYINLLYGDKSLNLCRPVSPPP